MFRFLSTILMIVFAVIHVNAASPMNMDGNATAVVIGNADERKQPNSAFVKLAVAANDCCDEEKLGKKSTAPHCQIECGLVGQQLGNPIFLQIQNVDFALGSFTISNESVIPLRPPIA